MSTGFYTDALTDSVKKQVDAQLALLPGEQLSVLEDAAIQRVVTKDKISDWCVARDHVVLTKQVWDMLAKAESPDPVAVEQAATANREAVQMKNALAERMVSALADQKDMCLGAAAVEHKITEQIATSTMTYFLGQVIALVHEQFNLGTSDSIQEMVVFEAKLRERIVAPDTDARSMAVEVEYSTMVDSVPRGPEENGSNSPTVSG